MRGQTMKRVVVLTCVALLVVIASGRIVKAFNPQPDPPALFGMVGITPEDTLQLNIVNVELAGLPPGPCNVTLRFLNSSGIILKQQTVTVKTKQAASYTITGVEAGGGFRNEVHPVLLLTSNEATGCSAIGSVEVFNTASGETTLLAHPIYINLPAAR
jgi:hypothetical protein